MSEILPPNQLFNFISIDALLAAIIDSSDDAIISKNLQGIVTSWNRGAERIFGYTQDEMVGQSITKVIPPDRIQEEPDILARLQRGERVDHFETIRVRKNGERIDVSLTISPVRGVDGTIVGASKIARDCSEQKAMLRKFTEANEQLQRADVLKSEFISTLSHELRTPLTSISGWIQILKDGASAQEVEEAVDVIDRNIRSQLRLINDLLDISRIESGKMTLDVQQIDLATILDAATDSIRPAAAAKGIRLTSSVSSGEGVVMGDSNRLQQIIWNLLTNAIKFTPKEGRVHTSLQRINSHVEVSVSDTGAGIPAEFIDHIFERFRQADASITRRHGGLGLGLAIAKHLAELHGGSVSATSGGKNQGATFVLSLPLLPVRPSSKTQTADTHGDQGDAEKRMDELNGIKVLVVDDDPDSLRIIQQILAKHGATVAMADSMNAALGVFDDFAPDVILSDIGMPDHDGYEFIGRVRKLPNGQKVPAVALTALARTEDRTRALRAGFQLHVTKPVDATELIAIVNNLASLRLGQR